MVGYHANMVSTEMDYDKRFVKQLTDGASVMSLFVETVPVDAKLPMESSQTIYRSVLVVERCRTDHLVPHILVYCLLYAVLTPKFRGWTSSSDDRPTLSAANM